MTPKEKALELVSKMCLNDCTDENIKLAKQFALIAVDEILKDDMYDMSEEFFTSRIEFWEQVKFEIEKL